MKQAKKILSIVLVLLMLVTGIPFVSANETTEGSAESESNLSADNGLGLIIENLTEEQEQEDAYNGGYSIFDLTVENGNVNVNLNVSNACTLVVAIYDENTSEMLYSATEKLNASVFTEEKREDIVSIDISKAVLPEHFLVKAFLLDEYNNALCKNYVCRTYTTAYEIFKATTPADFENKEIVTLDENCDDFGVLADGVVVGEKSEAMTYTYSDGVYTFSDATEEVKNLSVGDVFYYRTGDEISDFLLIKVKEIHVDGTTVSITEDDEIALDDAFQFFRIDAKADFSDVELTDDNLGDALSPVEHTEPLRVGANRRDVDITKEESWSKTLSVDYPPEKDKDDPYTSEFKATGSIYYTIKASTSIYYDARFGDDFYEFVTELTHTIGFNIQFTGKVECNKKAFGIKVSDIPLGSFLTLDITVYPILSVEAAVTFGGSCDIFNCLSYTDANGLSKTNDTKWWNLDGDFGKTEVTVKFGLGVEFDVGFKKGKEDADGLTTIHASVTAAVEVGLEGTFTPTLVGALLDKHHDCVFCLEGQLSVFANGKATLNIKIISNSLKIKYDAIDLTFKLLIGDCYFSTGKNGVKFGFGKCPHIRYKVTVSVYSIEGHSVLGAVVSTTTGCCDADGDKKFEETSMRTDTSGQAVFYFPAGKHELTATHALTGTTGGIQFEMVATEKYVSITLFDAVYFNGHYYKVIDQGLTWHAAKNACEKLGGHLITINTAAENAFIASVLSEKAKKNCYWTAITYDHNSNKWIHYDNSPIGAFNWADYEPNSFENNDETYVHLFGVRYTGGKGIKEIGEWNDASSNGAAYADSFYALSNFGYICEWESPAKAQSPLMARAEASGIVEDGQALSSITIEGTTASRTDAVKDTEYVLAVVKNENAEDLLSAENLLYIDQKAAESNTISFDFYLPEGVTEYTVKIFGAHPHVPSEEFTENETTATCTEAGGYDLVVYCTDCGKEMARENIKTSDPTGHEDADADDLCDICNESLLPGVLFGDVDGNGKIEAADARLALRAAVNLETLTEIQTAVADVDTDGEISSSDARALLRCAVGLEAL